MRNIVFITLIILGISSIPVYAVSDMVLVPGGWFPYQNTTPQIFVETFLIDKYETTNASYCQFLNGADPNGDHWISDMEIERLGSMPPYSYAVKDGYENYPVQFVHFDDANAFAQWKSNIEGVTYRLPTEEEWEKTAGWDQVKQHLYDYGFQQDDPNIDCNWCNYTICYGGPLPIGSFDGTGGKNVAKSYYGCYDMSGNVWEWTSGSIGSNRIIRGGDWYSGSAMPCMVTNRHIYDPMASNVHIGFRLVQEPPLLVQTPDGGENWIAGTTQTIHWEIWDANIIPDVCIAYSTNNGQDWNDVNTVANTGSYNWLVPQVTSNQCLVRISDANDANIFDTSDNTFTIFECRLNSKADLDGNCKVDMTDFALFANDWLRNGNPFDEGCTEDLPIIWVYINDPGVSGHEGFTGYMSKYETTNAQYCQFLNAALASGDITVSDNNVLGANGSNSGEDFVGEVYYVGNGPGFSYDGSTNGGAARINYSGGVFSVDSDFENHPVTYVSWYGATAFCNYYSYRLPTEWEWQGVADYNSSYTYGCGTSINNSIANYIGSTHPDGTTAVGAFGNYGYGMCDMAGNVWEWTSSISGSYRVLRGGGWYCYDYSCTVSHKDGAFPYYSEFLIGFRVCR